MRGRWMLVVAAGVALAGCGAAPSTSSSGQAEKPAKVEAIAGKNVKSVTLTEQADKRLGIETVTIAAPPAGNAAKALVPYSAVVYSADGKSWVFTVTKPRTYVRESVVVANVGGLKGSDAFLAESPAVGTTIVKTGVVELYGAELGVGGK
jgi:hypothetical protein